MGGAAGLAFVGLQQVITQGGLSFIRGTSFTHERPKSYSLVVNLNRRDTVKINSMFHVLFF